MDPVVSALGPKSTNLLIQSRPLSYRHLSTTESSSVLKIPIFKQSRLLLYRYLSTTDSFLGPRDTKLRTIGSASIIQTLLYYGQSSWSKRYPSLYNLDVYDTDTSLLRTVLLVPEVPNFIRSALPL